ncbi:helix-hairpin-helix domain-containing protein [Methanobacterium formicicum]|uniref:Helix-hairpin-helix domain-containing protein n=1 Tax=Methanobacterium formicicum (strain DSM 3637 / PP1) TaxID=1204725 RepID=K2R9G4_METFP|nr:helix-hairpin-helix domain-containing protein [Methanobacterium formicicum]EKF84964.1 hypothetical protein A994_11222 [Methanobacterium formicicum DSM 3637]
MSRNSWELINSWWIALTFGFFVYINWIAFIYIGITAKNRRWILFGVIYLIPAILIQIFAPSAPEQGMIVETNSLLGIILTLLFVMGIISIIHAFYLRKEYLLRLKTLKEMRDNQFRQQIVEEYESNNANLSKTSKNSPKREESELDSGFVKDLTLKHLPTPIDINNDPEDSLAELPGVSLILAKKAVQLRQSGIYYESAEDFGMALGLKPHIVEKIKPFIIINPLNENQTLTEPEIKGRRIDI